MKGKKVYINFGEEVAHKTIVGGRANKKESKGMSIPIGVEKLLYMAAVSPEFKKRLLENREKIIKEYDNILEDTEKTILRIVPDDQLNSMISVIDIKIHGKRRLFKSIAAACAISLGIASTNMSCNADDQNTNDVAIEDRKYTDVGGSRPDISDSSIVDVNIENDVAIEDREYFEVGGIRPEPPPSNDINKNSETQSDNISDQNTEEENNR